MTSPTEAELTAALVNLKSQFPHLGIAKIHARLLESHPEWLVSEKRTKRFLQLEGLTLTSVVGLPSPITNASNEIKALEGSAEPPVYPSSKLIEQLDVSQWSSKVKVKYFNKKKGKGLIATSDIDEGSTIWKEDPWVVAPEWEIFDMQLSSTACMYCTTPLNSDSPLINPCPSTTSSSTYCPARFCNRLCLSRSAKTHPLLCPVQNPASVPLIKWAKETRWMALHALTQSTARVLLANQLGDEAWSSDWAVMKGMAELGMEERYKWGIEGWANNPEPDRASWRKAYNLYIQAFKESKDPQAQKRLVKILKKPLPREADQELFDYEQGFLKGLGKMSLNLEAHGGLYTLHAHLNHSCIPNVSVRHLEQRTALSRITVIAKQPIKSGDELLVTYVNPSLGYKGRQSELKSWGFGPCLCRRCVDEGRQLREEAEKEGGQAGKDDLVDLASELKAGLGVI